MPELKTVGEDGPEVIAHGDVDKLFDAVLHGVKTMYTEEEMIDAMVTLTGYINSLPWYKKLWRKLNRVIRGIRYEI